MEIEQCIFPESVVWIWNPEATDEKCTNNRFGNVYYLPGNTNFDVIEDMVTESLLILTGKPSITETWNSLFIKINRMMKGNTSILNNNKW